MAILRAFVSLLLVTLGAGVGGLALSGYYEPRPTDSALPVAAPGSLEEEASPQGLLRRDRFVALDDRSAAGPAAKPKASAKASSAKAKAAAREKQPARNGRPQQAAVHWPWSLFGN
jgi:hypothetical protein